MNLNLNLYFLIFSSIPSGLKLSTRLTFKSVLSTTSDKSICPTT